MNKSKAMHIDEKFTIVCIPYIIYHLKRKILLCNLKEVLLCRTKFRVIFLFDK